MSSRELEYLTRDKGGYALKLIIENKLYKTDVDEGQNRLSMPLKQILSEDFLNSDEKMILNRSTKKRGLKNGVVVGFIGPCRYETTMVTKKRNFTRSSSSYVLIKNWHKIAMKNGLKKATLSRSGSSGSTNAVSRSRLCLGEALIRPKPANLNKMEPFNGPTRKPS